MQKGKINVQTENIFPIIKKFLYSDQEIFLRELISNAVDATQKIKTLALRGEFKEDLGNLAIEVLLDKKKKTLTVRDRGIGMDAEEIEKYINQIAFSSAEEFLAKYKSDNEASQIIGHFGLGFYSSFMVSEKVEIVSKSYKDDKAAVQWACTGSPEYTLKETEKKERGTDIILHIAKDADEYLEEFKILDLLKKYCKFLPVEIIFGTEKESVPIEGEKDKDGNPKTKEVEKPRVINNPEPAWTKKPADLKDEDYEKFYTELYPFTFEKPLFHIHLNVDYPFNLTGILYFPKLKKNLEVQKEKIQLYSNQVFVTDSVSDIVPEFLTLLHGVIDSPDIPLNVSRSFLQSDANVKKISNHISKKVADKLEEIFKNDREDFQKKWDDIKVFIQYGMISDEKFYERAEKFYLFKNTEGKFFTLEEYKKHIKSEQTDKDKKLIYIYTNNPDEHHAYIAQAKERGYDILLMDGVLDTHFINKIEQKLSDSSFIRVDAETADKLIKKQDELPSKLSKEDEEKLKKVIEENIEKEKFTVTLESLSESDKPMMITRPEFMRRMKDMSALGGDSYMGNLPDQFNLIINSNHPLMDRILKEEDESKKKEIISQSYDLALLAQNMLKGEKLTKFVNRSIDMM